MRDGNKGFEGREPGHTNSEHSVHGRGTPGKTTLTSRLSPGAAVQRKSDGRAPVASAAGSGQATGEDWTRVVFRPDLYSTPVQRKSSESGTEATASPAGATTHQQSVTVPLQATIGFDAPALAGARSPSGASGRLAGASAVDSDESHAEEQGSPGVSDHGAAVEQAGAQAEANAKPGEPLVLAALAGEPELIVEDHDALASRLTYSGHVSRGGAAPSGFGVTRSTLGRFANVTISPPRGGTIQVSASLTYTIQWETQSGTGPSGQQDVPSPTAAVLTQANYQQASSDLTPNMSDLGGRPPRQQFWAQDLTEQHERFHAAERRAFGGQAVRNAQSWLNRHTVANQAAVPLLLNQAWSNQVRAFIATAMANPGKEQRAYADGASAYTARATAIKQRGDSNQYSGGSGRGPSPNP
jgi:hypothetical protein